MIRCSSWRQRRLTHSSTVPLFQSGPFQAISNFTARFNRQSREDGDSYNPELSDGTSHTSSLWAAFLRLPLLSSAAAIARRYSTHFDFGRPLFQSPALDTRSLPTLRIIRFRLSQNFYHRSVIQNALRFRHCRPCRRRSSRW